MLVTKQQIHLLALAHSHKYALKMQLNGEYHCHAILVVIFNLKKCSLYQWRQRHTCNSIIPSSRTILAIHGKHFLLSTAKDEEDGNGLKLEEIGLAVFSAWNDRRTFYLDKISYFEG